MFLHLESPCFNAVIQKSNHEETAEIDHSAQKPELGRTWRLKWKFKQLSKQFWEEKMIFFI